MLARSLPEREFSLFNLFNHGKAGHLGQSKIALRGFSLNGFASEVSLFRPIISDT
jgi:hypothetical protein